MVAGLMGPVPVVMAGVLAVGAENHCHPGRFAGKCLRSGPATGAGGPVCTWLCVR